eukprot:scaffold150_cov151-Skeletonema_menzelii.AAC.4
MLIWVKRFFSKRARPVREFSKTWPNTRVIGAHHQMNSIPSSQFSLITCESPDSFLWYNTGKA